MGAALDRRRFEHSVLQKTHRFRMRRRHILLGKLLRHLLAQEARPHARRLLLERAHKSGRGTASRFRVRIALKTAGEVFGRNCSRDCARGCGHREDVRDGSSARRPHRHERDTDDGIHRVCRGSPSHVVGRRQLVRHDESFRLDGAHLVAGEDELFREASGRVPEVRFRGVSVERGNADRGERFHD